MVQLLVIISHTIDKILKSVNAVHMYSNTSKIGFASTFKLPL